MVEATHLSMVGKLFHDQPRMIWRQRVWHHISEQLYIPEADLSATILQRLHRQIVGDVVDAE
jgi:hypothetical protein